ncbi:MAG: hypothetical protein H6Q86_5307 [candidate division NC10 bacterium]|nr:hypothetical protein [candidate division NC10 bacterium]
MKRKEFQRMWDEMQKDGYFSHHPHYADWTTDQRGMTPAVPDRIDLEEPPEPPFDHLDFTACEVVFPRYSVELERAIKRNEYFWLPKMFAIPCGGTVLDVGCGFGRSLEWMRTIYGRCMGVDVSETAIRMAADRFAGIDGVEFRVGPGDGLPAQVADRSVDLIYAFNVFEHIPRSFAAAYLRDFVRVLRPTGCAVFNLLSGIQEHAQDGPPGSEWRIGYSANAATSMIHRAGLRVAASVRWSLPDSSACWLWFQVSA